MSVYDFDRLFPKPVTAPQVDELSDQLERAEKLFDQIVKDAILKRVAQQIGTPVEGTVVFFNGHGEMVVLYNIGPEK